MSDQLTREDLRSMTVDEIDEALQAGRLATLLGGGPPHDPERPSREDLARMSPDDIVKARSEGRLDHLLGGPNA